MFFDQGLISSIIGKSDYSTQKTDDYIPDEDICYFIDSRPIKLCVLYYLHLFGLLVMKAQKDWLHDD